MSFTFDKLVESDDRLIATLSLPRLSGGEWAKIVHDLNSSIRTLQLCLDELSRGYHFDDAIAGAKIEALKKAVHHVSSQQAVLIEISKKCADL
jgi:hypothetical protein